MPNNSRRTPTAVIVANHIIQQLNRAATANTCIRMIGDGIAGESVGSVPYKNSFIAIIGNAVLINISRSIITIETRIFIAANRILADGGCSTLNRDTRVVITDGVAFDH